jgi:hypothetical protein
MASIAASIDQMTTPVAVMVVRPNDSTLRLSSSFANFVMKERTVSLDQLKLLMVPQGPIVTSVVVMRADHATSDDPFEVSPLRADGTCQGVGQPGRLPLPEWDY